MKRNSLIAYEKYNDKTNCKEHYNRKGNLHREGDKPAVICDDGKRVWYKDGKRHRDNDKPAYIFEDNGWKDKRWYKNGKRHRDGDKPAVVFTDEDIGIFALEWWIDNKLHRYADKPAYIRENQTIYAKGGKYHRDKNLPAIINSNGELKWFKRDKLICKFTPDKENTIKYKDKIFYDCYQYVDWILHEYDLDIIISEIEGGTYKLNYIPIWEDEIEKI